MSSKRVAVDLGVLGPLTLTLDGEPVPLTSMMRRRLLGVLICHANTVVSMDRIAEALWRDPPSSAPENIRQYVYQLRQAFKDNDRIVREGQGYRLRVEDGELDAARFESLSVEADQALGDGDFAWAQKLLTEALALWRGEPYADLDGVALVQPRVTRLAEARLAAVEQRFEAGLRLGRHRALVTELASDVAEHPLRERLRGQWMLALYRCGRQAEALEAYRQGRRLLAEELGLEPGPELRRLEQVILENDPDLDLPDAASAATDPRPTGDTAPRQASHEAVPMELPADVATFTGRLAEVVRLRRLLGGGSSGAETVVVIAGTGGIGKSTLAVHVGHRLAERFPDGQLYVNLRGSTPDVKALDPAEALARLLRSLGAEGGPIPADVDEAATRFRSATEGRRLLLLLDNALDSAQVRPLIPASESCGVLVTSRRMLTGLDGAVHERLDVLSPADGCALLSRLIGAERVDAEPEAATAVVERCGRLPLAIRIAAARLNARPSWSVGKLADRLDTERRRLTELEADDQGIRASFAVSYQDLDYDHARMFRLISLLNVTDMGVPVAAALADLDEEDAEDLLDDLAEAQLADTYAPGRYRMHDLLRLFARERAAEADSDQGGAQAVERGLHCYLATARAACNVAVSDSAWRTEVGPRELNHPGSQFSDDNDLYTWIDDEADNLVGVAAQSAHLANAGPALAVGLSATLGLPLHRRGRARQRLRVAQLAADAAERAHDNDLQAVAYGELGAAKTFVGQLPEALALFMKSLEAGREAGVPPESVQHQRIGSIQIMMGRFDEAIDSLSEAIRIFRAQGVYDLRVSCLSTLGLAYLKVGRNTEALNTLAEAVETARELGAKNYQAQSLLNLAHGYRASGDAARAIECYEAMLDVPGEGAGSGIYNEAECWWGLGFAHYDLGDRARARELWDRSATILADLNLISTEDKQAIESSTPPETPEIIRRNL